MKISRKSDKKWLKANIIENKWFHMKYIEKYLSAERKTFDPWMYEKLTYETEGNFF